MEKGVPWVGHWSEPWNRGPWDRVLWQVKWANVALRRLCNLRRSLGLTDEVA